MSRGWARRAGSSAHGATRPLRNIASPPTAVRTAPRTPAAPGHPHAVRKRRPGAADPGDHACACALPDFFAGAAISVLALPFLPFLATPLPTASLSSSTLGVFSQVNSGSSRPK